MSLSYFKRLPPELRLTILDQLSSSGHDEPVSIAKIVHTLSKQYRDLEMSETTLKSSIAEVTIEQGRTIAFDGT